MKFWPKRQLSPAQALAAGLLFTGVAVSLSLALWLNKRIETQTEAQ